MKGYIFSLSVDITHKIHWRNLLKLQIPAFLQTQRSCFSRSCVTYSRCFYYGGSQEETRQSPVIISELHSEDRMEARDLSPRLEPMNEKDPHAHFLLFPAVPPLYKIVLRDCIVVVF